MTESFKIESPQHHFRKQIALPHEDFHTLHFEKEKKINHFQLQETSLIRKITALHAPKFMELLKMPKMR